MGAKKSSKQYRYVLQTKMKMKIVKEEKCLELFQHLSMVLMGVFRHRDKIVLKASSQVLQELILITGLVGR